MVLRSRASAFHSINIVYTVKTHPLGPQIASFTSSFDFSDHDIVLSANCCYLVAFSKMEHSIYLCSPPRLQQPPVNSSFMILCIIFIVMWRQRFITFNFSIHSSLLLNYVRVGYLWRFEVVVWEIEQKKRERVVWAVRYSLLLVPKTQFWRERGGAFLL